MALTNFQQRAITSVFFVSILIGGILLNHYTLLVLFLALTFLGVKEFYVLSKNTSAISQDTLGIVLAIFLYLSVSLACFYLIPFWVILLNIPFGFIVFIAELYRNKTEPFTNIAYTLLALIYVALPFTLAVVFASPYCNKSYFFATNLLGYFFLLWANDTGAYLSGRLFGKTKLFERVSPKKTWEGTIGGLLLAFIVAFVIAKYFTNILLVDWLVIAFIVTTIGSLGDLVESMFKRSIHVKDSGTILPGHGGILDRFDGLFISMPFVCVYLYIMHQIR